MSEGNRIRVSRVGIESNNTKNACWRCWLWRRDSTKRISNHFKCFSDIKQVLGQVVACRPSATQGSSLCSTPIQSCLHSCASAFVNISEWAPGFLKSLAIDPMDSTFSLSNNVMPLRLNFMKSRSCPIKNSFSAVRPLHSLSKWDMLPNSRC